MRVEGKSRTLTHPDGDDQFRETDFRGGHSHTRSANSAACPRQDLRDSSLFVHGPHTGRGNPPPSPSTYKPKMIDARPNHRLQRQDRLTTVPPPFATSISGTFTRCIHDNHPRTLNMHRSSYNRNRSTNGRQHQRPSRRHSTRQIARRSYGHQVQRLASRINSKANCRTAKGRCSRCTGVRMLLPFALLVADPDSGEALVAVIIIAAFIVIFAMNDKIVHALRPVKSWMDESVRFLLPTYTLLTLHAGAHGASSSL